MNLIPDVLYPSLSDTDKKHIDELMKACRKQHKRGPGGQAFCICMYPSGGSPACSGLAVLARLLHQAYDPAWGGKTPPPPNFRPRDEEEWPCPTDPSGPI